MIDKQIIIDGKTIGCPCYINRPLHRYDKACFVQSQVFTEQQTEEKPILRCDEIKNCPIKENYKQLKRKEQECEELHSRTASIIYSLTGGRLSYSTYTLEGCEQAYHDQLEIDVERATKELQKKLQAKEQLSVKQSHELIRLRKERQENKQKNVNLLQKNEELEKQLKNEKQALDEIEKIANKQRKFDLRGKTPLTPVINEVGGDFIDILDIINKAKEK